MLDIIKATYGPLDITEKVLSMYKSGTRSFYPSNDDWGDTNFGVTKHLKIKYKIGDETVEKSA